MVVLRLIKPQVKATLESSLSSYKNLLEEALSFVEASTGSEVLKNSDLVLVHHGKVLSSDDEIAKLGPASAVNILFRKKVCIETPRKLTEEEISQLVFAFRTALLNSKFRTTLMRVGTPENIESLCAATPGLRQDPVALAYLHNFELLLQFTNHAAAKKIAERHPALADAATQIAAMGHEGSDSALETAALLALHQAEGEALEGSDDDDSMQSPESPAVSRQRYMTPGGGTPQAPITPAFLSAALAMARGQGQSQASSSPASPARNPAGISQSLLTPEMMQNALRSAFASPSTPSTSNAAGRQERTAASQERRSERRNAVESLRERYGQFLPQMREVGILNDELSLRALDATTGDIQAAVNLIFAGMLD